jgi:hypothetical protein
VLARERKPTERRGSSHQERLKTALKRPVTFPPLDGQLLAERRPVAQFETDLTLNFHGYGACPILASSS